MDKLLLDLLFLLVHVVVGIMALPIYIATLIGTFIGFGQDGTLLYILNSLVFLGIMLIIKPKLEIEDRNEKKKLGTHVMSAVFLVQAFQIFSLSFTIGDVLNTILQCIIVYIFYKIFVNAIPLIANLGIKKAFSSEEAISAAILFAITICAIGPLTILEFSVKNILCILLVLMLAWRNGALIGATTGVSIAVILTMLGFSDSSAIAIYAVAGIVTGILSKAGKIGILLELVVGFAIVYFLNDIQYLNYIKEILIASVFLLVIPPNITISIEDIIGKNRFLPVTKDNRLTENKEAVYKLNSMSKTIEEIAKSYKEVAATVVDDIDYIEKNRQIFIEDLKLNLEQLSDNMLYDDLIEEENGIVNDIFDLLMQKEEIENEDLIKVFENHNSYIIAIEDKEAQKDIEKQIYKVVKNINYTYQISKAKFIWERKASEHKKVVSEQFDNVSKVINNIAKDIDKMENSNLEELNPKFHLNIGISRTTKNGSKVSGDSSTQLKLKDGKYLIALSDGMGSGEKARKNSRKAIKILENLFSAGFKKDESLSLINSALNTNPESDMYATLDIVILDLNSGNIELIKSGACPTYIKTKDEVQVIKADSIPAGMIEKIEAVTFDRDIENGDIFVMCTDGIIDSSGKTNETWLKQVLQGIQTDNVQKIADIIIGEAIDNGLGLAKDDMTIIVAKIEEN